MWLIEYGNIYFCIFFLHTYHLNISVTWMLTQILVEFWWNFKWSLCQSRLLLLTNGLLFDKFSPLTNFLIIFLVNTTLFVVDFFIHRLLRLQIQTSMVFFHKVKLFFLLASLWNQCALNVMYNFFFVIIYRDSDKTQYKSICEVNPYKNSIRCNRNDEN